MAASAGGFDCAGIVCQSSQPFKYPYDLIEDEGPSLRANADDVTATLQAELQDRLEEAVVAVRDCRLRRLAYAAEIAGEMLRRQQAGR